MSFSILKLIPTSPSFVPEMGNQEQALNQLKQFFPFAEITIKVTDEIEFIDQGQNFEKVSCNLCGQEINGEYWQEVMDNSLDSNFHNLTFVSSCCQRSVSLNDLEYQSPAGFSRFFIEITNATRELHPNEVTAIESALAIPIRQIWALY